MGSFLSKYKYQVILIFLGLIWIMLLNALLQIKGQNIIYPDSDNYREAAFHLYKNFKSHYYRPLGMALLFGIPYLFGGGDASVYEFSFFINLLAWLGTALLLFRLLRKYLSDNKALVFTMLFYSLLGSAFIIFHLLTESVFTFLVLLSFYFLDKYFTNKLFHNLAFALCLFLFCMLIKPGSMFFAVCMVIFFGRELIRNYNRGSMIPVYLILSLIVFHCARMKQEYGNFTISYIDGVTYYNYLGNTAMGLKTGTDFQKGLKERSDYIFGLSLTQQKVIAANDMKEQLKTNALNLIKAYFIDLVHNTKTPSDCISICENINETSYFEPVKKALIIISKYQNRFFSVAGLLLALYYLLRSYKKPDICTFISFYILYTIAISGISSHQGDRFHIVFFPFVIILAGKFYAESFAKHTLNL